MGQSSVSVWEEKVVIPTYEVGKPDKNPMFLEKRVYQGSSGKVYPLPVIDKIYDEKVDKEYQAVYLENEYVKIMLLPELGGRVQRAYDKTNDYDFVYYNHVIKPALVGLCGPWISGGIEFNWPQHHRPTTFSPAQYTLEQNEDGSATVWVGEIEPMFRTKGMTGFTLYPGKAYLEIKVKLYNRTDLPQTFLWWANPAVAVNDHTQSIFPPDVHAVMDHGKRAVSNFPIATGTYYKCDYSRGVDISRYKNIPVPTSYMAYHSDYDFVGGYDYGKEAGILHIADHHVSPGKKQWTWGCGEFGQAWDRNLTDEDGPYIELMTGCYTDNQPDFSWLEPYEEKNYTQYFMPYKKVGRVTNATLCGAVRLDVTGDVMEDGQDVSVMAADDFRDGKGSLGEKQGSLTVYMTGRYPNARVEVTCLGECCYEKTVDLAPDQVLEDTFALTENGAEEDYVIRVFDEQGTLLVSGQKEKEKLEKIPEAAKPAPMPEEIDSLEDFFLYGKHLEQYRHATYEPADYYLAGLKKDPTDIRLNNAYGSLLLRRGKFAESEGYFRKAMEKITRSNPNPYDGEPHYNLGLSLKYQGKQEEAYDAFYKAVWNGAWQDAGFYQLACLDVRKGQWKTALEHVEASLIRNWHHMKARGLKAAILRHLGRTEEAKRWLEESLAIDRLDFVSHLEFWFLMNDESERDAFMALTKKDAHTLLELALDYEAAGLFAEAKGLLSMIQVKNPLIWYHMGHIQCQEGNMEAAEASFGTAEKTDSSYCFPYRLEDILALEKATELRPMDAKAWYYLGILWYDKKQYGDAISCLEQSAALDDTFPTVFRNLSIAYYNKEQNPQKARTALEKAYHLDESDARVLMELDQLYKKMNVSVEERLAMLQAHMEQVKFRDDLYLEYVTLQNLSGRHETALQLIADRKFHPWEGGEGKVPAQYLLALTELAKKELKKGAYESALTYLQQATGSYPHNLGEGKLAGAQENNIYYYMGCAYEGLGQREQAKECWTRASEGLSEPAGMMYYNDQPPEMIYYQGMALLKLERRDEAMSRFNCLIDYGSRHMFDDFKIDYFAVSLPDLLIFDEDLNEKNKIHCSFMLGLGYLGKGETKKAEEMFEEILKKNPVHNCQFVVR